MRKTFELLTGAALAATLGLASAQMTPPPSSSPSHNTPMPGSSSSPSSAPASASEGDAFAKLDTDHDGVISKKEAAKNKDLLAKWNALDTSKDGKLDPAEFAAFEAPTPSK